MAMARKTKQRKFPQAEFEIPIADAVGLLLRPRDIEPGDTFQFQVNGVDARHHAHRHDDRRGARLSRFTLGRRPPAPTKD